MRDVTRPGPEPPRGSKAFRLRPLVLGLALALVSGVAASAQPPARFVAPHRVRAGRAALSSELRARLDAARRAEPPASADALVEFALAQTAIQLHFGLDHVTSLRFDEAEREGHCVEYAELFVAILQHARGALDVQAWVVRSDARILGRTIPDPAFREHDWVLVRAREGGTTRLLYLDPTFSDMGLAADLSRAVDGDVQVPARSAH